MSRRMPKRTNGGFSLFDLQDVLKETTETLASALASQGVNADYDNLFMELQLLLKRFGSGQPNAFGTFASDSRPDTPAELPYNFAGDILAIAYDSYQSGDKREALKLMAMAMEMDDFEPIVNGMLMLNQNTKLHKKIEAEDEENPPTDEDLEEDDNDNEISDADLDRAISEAEDELNKGDEEEDDEEDDEDNSETPPVKAPPKSDGNTDKPRVPMGGTSSQPKTTISTEPKPDQQVPVTASESSRIMANKLSLSGKPTDRDKARKFVVGSPNL